MIVVIIAMVLMSPTLHTQTPTGVTPPTNGGTGGGGGGSGTGTGGGSGNNTVSNCTTAGDDQNDTDQSIAVVHTSDGNQTSEAGDQDEGACGASGVDHDSTGDAMSHDHNGHGDDGLADAVSADALVLAQNVGTWVLASFAGMVPLAESLAAALAGLASHGAFLLAVR